MERVRRQGPWILNGESEEEEEPTEAGAAAEAPRAAGSDSPAGAVEAWLSGARSAEPQGGSVPAGGGRGTMTYDRKSGWYVCDARASCSSAASAVALSGKGEPDSPQTA
eukprot:1613041-Rhodomonas_salina.1